jgi:hypothetical protein
MKVARLLGGIWLVLAVTLGASRVMGDESYEGRPLTQVEFNHLVPITYPLVTTKFTALKPTSYPVIQPGVARVHIIDRLVHPLEQPLLRTHGF